MNSHWSRKGFTLIEVMIAVAIVAILVAVAFPSYRDSMLKGRRAEAKAALARTMQAEERFYTANNVYLAFASTATVPSGFSTHSSNSPNFAYSIQAADCGATALQCVKVTATAVQSDPLCGTMTMYSDGTPPTSTPTASSTASTGCW